MQITNKFNLGDIVYYPAADLRSGKVLKSVVTGIVVTEVDGKVDIIYQTGQSYAVSQEDMFKTAKPAKRRLIKIMQDKKKDIAKDIDESIKTIDKTGLDELVINLIPQDEETQDVETTEEVE